MTVPSATGSRQVATSTRAMSSVQYPSSTRGVEWSACSNVPMRVAHRREVPEARLRRVHVLIPAATSSDAASSS